MESPDDILEDLAPGVRGYTTKDPTGLYIPVIVATKSDRGDVGRYLASLPRDTCIKVPTVTSAVLVGMLERRGFVETHEWAEEFGCWSEVWVLYPPGQYRPRATGRCLVPPHGLTFFEYHPERHGRLVPLGYATAVYDGRPAGT